MAITVQNNLGFLIAAVVKCVLVGLAVGSAGIPLCFLGAVFFYALRDMGIFLLLFSIPVGAFCTWRLTRKYLARETNRLRGAIAYGTRYFFLGAGLGFLLAGYACNVAGTTFLGGSIGAMIGSLGGAFQGWFDSEKYNLPASPISEKQEDTQVSGQV